jgi:hypothetical protein
MNAYLRTVKARLGTNTSDVTLASRYVTLDVSDDTFLELGVTIDAVISAGNSGRPDAYLDVRYPTVEFLGLGNLEFGAVVLSPEAAIPGTFPVGTAIRFKVQ